MFIIVKITIALIIANLLYPINLEADQLESALLYDLKPYSQTFLDAQEDTGINVLFLASIAALESDWGRSEVSKEYNNLFGWTCDDGAYMQFDSKEECIEFVADKLKSKYLEESGNCYNGTSLAGVNKKYNGREEWEDEVENIMLEMKNTLIENKFAE